MELLAELLAELKVWVEIRQLRVWVKIQQLKELEVFNSLKLSIVVTAEVLVEIAIEVLVEILAEILAMEVIDAECKNLYIVGAQSFVESIYTLLLY